MRYSSLRFHFPSSFSSTFYCPSSIPLLLFILPSSLPPPSFQYLLSLLSFRPSPSYILHHSLHSISIPPPPTPPQHSSAPPLLPLPPPFHNDRRVAICCILVIVVDEKQTCLEVGAPPSWDVLRLFQHHHRSLDNLSTPPLSSLSLSLSFFFSS